MRQSDAAGLVHCDVKPANLLLRSVGAAPIRTPGRTCMSSVKSGGRCCCWPRCRAGSLRSTRLTDRRALARFWPPCIPRSWPGRSCGDRAARPALVPLADPGMSGVTDGDPVRAAYDVLAPDYAAQFRSTEPDPADRPGHDRPLRGAARRGAGRAGRRLRDWPDVALPDRPGLPGQGDRPVSGHDPDGPAGSPGHPDRRGHDHRAPLRGRVLDGLFYWYSIIHLPDAAVPKVFEEARRVLRPGGQLLVVAFQIGAGERDVAGGLRRRGYDVSMSRYHRSPDDVATALRSACFDERARLVRSPAGGHEREGQAVVVARLETRA